MISNMLTRATQASSPSCGRQTMAARAAAAAGTATAATPIESTNSPRTAAATIAATVSQTIRRRSFDSYQAIERPRRRVGRRRDQGRAITMRNAPSHQPVGEHEVERRDEDREQDDQHPPDLLVLAE